MKYLGRRRRAIALILLTFGLFTFFEPLITTDPPVMGRMRLSIFDLVRWSHELKPPPNAHNPPDVYRGRPFFGGWNFWVDFVSIYPIILLVLACLCFFPAQKLLAAVSLVGALISFGNWQENNFGNIGLQFMLYGDFRPGRVECAGLWLVLLTVMVILAFVSFHDGLDG